MRDVICTECNNLTGLKRHHKHLLHKTKQFACKDCLDRGV